MSMHPNEVFRRQRGHIETLQGQVKNLQATNLSLLFKVVFGKEDLIHTLPKRVTPGKPGCCVCGTSFGLRQDGWYGYRCSSDDCVCF